MKAQGGVRALRTRARQCIKSNDRKELGRRLRHPEPTLPCYLKGPPLEPHYHHVGVILQAVEVRKVRALNSGAFGHVHSQQARQCGKKRKRCGVDLGALLQVNGVKTCEWREVAKAVAVKRGTALQTQFLYRHHNVRWLECAKNR